MDALHLSFTGLRTSSLKELYLNLFWTLHWILADCRPPFRWQSKLLFADEWVAQFFPIFPSNSTVLCLLGLVDILAPQSGGSAHPFPDEEGTLKIQKPCRHWHSWEWGARAASPTGVSRLSELQRMSQKSWVPILPLPMILCIIIFPLSFLSWKTGVIIFPYLQKLLGGLLHCCECHRWKVLQKNKLQLLFQTSALILSSLTYWITLTQSRKSCHYTEDDHWKRWLCCNKSIYPLVFNTLLPDTGVIWVI